jgi:hypothetical protein
MATVINADVLLSSIIVVAKVKQNFTEGIFIDFPEFKTLRRMSPLGFN